MTDLPNDRVPPSIELHLSDLQRALLGYVMDRLPNASLAAILQGVFSRGLAIVVGEEAQKLSHLFGDQPRSLSGLTVSGSKIPFSKPKYRKPSPVPDTLVVRLDDELRDDLERMLLSEQGSSLESLVETALRQGLEGARSPGAMDPAPVFEEIKTKEAKEVARTRRRRMMARLHALAR